LGTNLLNVIPGRTRDARGLRSAPASGIARPLTMDDVRAIERQATLLRGVSPMVMGGGTVRYKQPQRDTMVLGVGPAFSDLRNMHVDLGEFVRERGRRLAAARGVLGRTRRARALRRREPLGQPIRLAGGRFRVVGSWRRRGTLARLRPRRPGVHPRHLGDGPVQSRPPVAAARGGAVQGGRARGVRRDRAVLARRRNGEKTFTIQSQDDLLKTFGALTAAMTLMLLAIASISLVVGGIGIMNIMLVSVRERTREIGVRRAVGATKSDILWQFLLESVVISSIGRRHRPRHRRVHRALAQALRSLDVPVALSPWIAAVAFGSSFVVGVLSGVVPRGAPRSSTQVDALRYE
jgi:putative ABC transport system permease protein